MENLIDVIGYGLSQVGLCFFIALSLVYLFAVVEQLVIKYQKHMGRFIPPSQKAIQPRPIHSTPPPPPMKSKQIQQSCARINTQQLRYSVIQLEESLKLLQSEVERLAHILNAIQSATGGFMASMRRDTQRLPAQWIPSLRQRKKRRRITSSVRR